MDNKRTLRGFLTGSLTIAFLAVAAPAEAPAQGFDMMNPNNIMNPIHPLNPLTDPFNAWGTHNAPETAPPPAMDNATATHPSDQNPAKKPAEAAKDLSKEQILGFGLAGFALSLLAAAGLAANAVSRPQNKPRHPISTPPHLRGGGGGDF